MGKPKSKSKKRVVEDNEFLKDLIDEVQSLETEDDDVVSEDSRAESLVLVRTKDDNEYVQGIIENNLEHSDEEIELPTAFAHIQKDIKPPKLGEDEEPAESRVSNRSNDKTVPSIEVNPEIQILDSKNQSTSVTYGSSEATIASAESDRTVAVKGARGGRGVLQEKIATGALKGTRGGQVYTSLDASLAQAETLKIAQVRIKELEVEIDRLRQENDDLSSAGDIVSRKMEEYQVRVQRLEKEKSDLIDQSKNERLILKGNLQFKETELSKSKAKLEDLEMRIKTDFRKIRVRERELENRLELVRAEKQALMRAKDEKILDLQRKLDQYKAELDLYRSKVQDLNKMMENQQEQMQKTIRALRVALVNLEPEDLNQVLDSVDADIENEGEEELKKAK